MAGKKKLTKIIKSNVWAGEVEFVIFDFSVACQVSVHDKQFYCLLIQVKKFKEYLLDNNFSHILQGKDWPFLPCSLTFL